MGVPKTKIGNHYTKVDEALAELKSYFRNPHVVWSHQLEMFKKTFENKSVWDSYCSQTFVMAIAPILEFIRKGK